MATNKTSGTSDEYFGDVYVSFSIVYSALEYAIVTQTLKFFYLLAKNCKEGG